MSAADSTLPYRTLLDVFLARARRQPHAIALTFVGPGDGDDVSLTAGQLDHLSRCGAAHLQTLARVGDRAIVLCPASLEYMTAVTACFYAGLVAVPAYAPDGGTGAIGVAGLIADSGAAIGLTTRAMLPEITAQPALAGVRWVAIDALPGDMAETWQRPDIAGESAAYLLYTSGSTAHPKGVIRTHANLIATCEAWRQWTPRGADDCSLMASPPHMSASLGFGFVFQRYVGARACFLAPEAVTGQPERWLQALSATRATCAFAPNFLFEQPSRSGGAAIDPDLDLSALRHLLCGMEKVRADVLERFQQRFARHGLRAGVLQTGYGATEVGMIARSRPGTSLTVSIFDRQQLQMGQAVEVAAGNHGLTLVGQGAPLPFQRVELVDPERMARCPPGTPGEIWVSGPAVSPGYWNRPAETAEAFGAALADTGEGGFYRTGDLGFIHADELYITGRIKDVVIIRGRNISVLDVEASVQAAYRALAGYATAAFAQDIDSEERLVVVQEAEAHEASEAGGSIARAIQDAVTRDHGVQVHRIVLVPRGAIPKIGAGKIGRAACRTHLEAGLMPVLGQFDAGIAGTRQRTPYRAPRTETEHAIVRVWERVLAVSPIGTDDHFVELGGDSLTSMEVLTALTEIGLPVTQQDIKRHRTVRAIAAALDARAPLDAPRASSPPDGPRPTSPSAADAHGCSPFRTMIDVFRSWATEQPEAAAFTVLGEDWASMTAARFDDLSRCGATHLQSIARPGDRAIVLAPVGLDYLLALSSCLYAGLVGVPADATNLHNRAEAVAGLIADSGATVGLTTRALLPLVTTLTHLGGVQWVAIDAVPQQRASAWRPPEIDGDSLALLIYTSGSTSGPKAVMRTQRNLVEAARAWHRASETEPGERLLIASPLHVAATLILAFACAPYARAHVHLLPPEIAAARPGIWLGALSQTRARVTFAPNYLLDQPGRSEPAESDAPVDLSALRHLFCGGEMVRPDVLARFERRFTPHGLRPGALRPCYGATEVGFIAQPPPNTAPVISTFSARPLHGGQEGTQSREADGGRAVVGHGLPVPGVRIEIVDPERMTRCAPGHVGEVWASGPAVSPGYWNRPEDTVAAFGAVLADTGEGPFYRTGDLGFFCGDNLYITGRIKDIVIIRGRNISVLDVEASVQQAHDAVRGQGTAAFAQEIDGEEHLVVVQEVDAALPQDVRSAVASAIQNAVAQRHGVQASVVVLVPSGAIPIIGAGKMARAGCRAQLAAGTLPVLGRYQVGDAGVRQRVPFRGARTPTEHVVVRVWERVLHIEHVGIDDPFAELGGDSLMSMEVLAALRDVGLTLTIEDIHQHRTVAAMAAAIDAHAAARTAHSLPGPDADKPRAEPSPMIHVSDSSSTTDPHDISPAHTLLDSFRMQAERQPDVAAVTFLGKGDGDEVSMTIGHLDRLARSGAAHLQRMAEVGDRALVLCPAGPEYLAATLACLYAGLVAVPAYAPNVRDRAEALAGFIHDCDAAIGVTARAMLPEVTGTPGVEHLQWVAVDDVPDNADTWRPPAITGDSPAFIMYTSGSTSRPKGVIRTHTNLIAALRAFHVLEVSRPFDSVLITGPMHITANLILGVVLPMYAGVRAYVLPSEVVAARPESWLETLSRTRANCAFAPNFLLHEPARSGPVSGREHLDLSTLHHLFCGGEMLRPDVLEQFVQRFAPSGLRRDAPRAVYGSTEVTLMAQPPAGAITTFQTFDAARLQDGVAVTALEADSGRTLVGHGLPVPGVRIEIVDPERMTRCAPGHVGEVWASGPAVSPGYWNRPEDTVAAFGAVLADTGEGPFYRTGDLGFFCGDNLYITGRIKDIVIIRGRNISVLDVEASVQQAHDAVRGQGTAAFAQEIDGEERLVVVQEVDPATDAGVADDIAGEIQSAVVQHHGVQAYLVLLVPHGAIPTLRTGKIGRAACRAQLAAGTLPALARFQVGLAGARRRTPYRAPNTPAERAIAHIWERVLHIEHVGIDDPFAELGGDSLMSMEVLAALTGAGFPVTVDDINRHRTVAALAAVLEGREEPVRQEDELPRHLVPVLPAQRQVLDQSLAAGAWAVVCFVMEARRSLDPLLLEQAARELFRHHEALRQRFGPTHDGWASVYAHSEPPDLLSVRDLHGTDPEVEETAIREEIGRQVTQIDMLEERYLRLALIRRSGAPDLLVTCAHHAVVDHVSMMILLADLDRAYTQLERGERVRLPRQTTATTIWSERLATFAASTEMRNALGHWLQTAIVPPTMLAPDFRRDPNGTYSRQTVLVQAPQTIASGVGHLGHAGLDLEVAIQYGLTRALSDVAGANTVRFNVMTHGRAPLFPDVDLTRTVGYLATGVPIVVRIDPSADPVDAARSLQCQVHQVPHHGLGARLLPGHMSPPERLQCGASVARQALSLLPRYAGRDRKALQGSRALRNAAALAGSVLRGEEHPPMLREPQYHVQLNYLGNVDGRYRAMSVLRQSAHWAAIGEEVVAEARGAMPWHNQIEIRAMVMDRSLSLAIDYCDGAYARSTIQQFAERIVEHTGALVRAAENREN